VIPGHIIPLGADFLIRREREELGAGGAPKLIYINLNKYFAAYVL